MTEHGRVVRWAARRRPYCTLTLICVGLLHSTAFAQLFDRATVIENAHIVTGTGRDFESGSMVIKGGRIVELGAKVKAPMFARKIDASGKTITPGLIDVWSALAHLGSSSTADPTARASSAIAQYAHHTLTDALRNGVTAAYVGPGNGYGINGIGAIIRATAGEGGPRAVVVDDDVALCINLGSDQSPVQRLKTYKDVRGAFRAALDYRQALEDYEEDLEEYLEKLEERRKEKDKKAKENGEDEDNTPADDEAQKDEADDDGKKDKPEPKPEPKPDPQPEPKPEPTPEPDGDSDDDTLARRRKRGRRPQSADADEAKQTADAEKKNGEDKDELKKPDKPAPDRKSTLLLRAVDHELPIRVTAQRSADILNALELAAEFKLDLIIEGATEAHLVTAAIAESEATVVLGAVAHGELFDDNTYMNHSLRNAAALSAAEIPWSIGSGASTSRTARFVEMNARLAVAHGATQRSWLELVTTRPARALGVRRLGRIGRGMPADMVLWSGHPDDPAARVDMVLLGGQVAYEAAGPGGDQ